MFKPIAASGMSLNELEGLSEYAMLTPRQRIFVSALIRNLVEIGKLDLTAAVQAAYVMASTENARIFAYQLLTKKRIAVVLKRYADFGKTPAETDLAEVETQIAAAKPGSEPASRLLALKQQLRREIAAAKNLRAPSAVAEPEAKATVAQIDPRVPGDALQVWYDKTSGMLLGYRAANGEAVRV